MKQNKNIEHKNISKQSKKELKIIPLIFTSKYDNIYKKIFWVIIIICTFIFPYLSFDYGITWDETLQNEYGKEILKYFETFGKEKEKIFPGGFILYSETIYYYSGFFDFLAAITYKYLNLFGEYENRHVLNSLFGVITLIYTGLIAKETLGWRAALLSLIFLLSTPLFIGHSMNNPKDIPFAASYVFAIFYILKYLPQMENPSKKILTLMATAIAFTINIRIGGLIIIGYLLFFSLITIIKKYLSPEITSGKIKKIFIQLFTICVIGYLAGLIFWPFGHAAPIKNPLEAFTFLSKTSVSSDWTVLFGGKTIILSQMPWYYIPKWMAMTIPVIVICGFSLFMLTSLIILKAKDYWKILILVFTLFFPVSYAIFQKSIIYDSWRHFLFVYPVLLILSVAGFEFLLRKVKLVYQKIVYIIMLILISIPLKWMIVNHPHQYVYFNPLFGGINNCWQLYETDYWGNGLRLAAEWLGKYCNDKYPGKKFMLWVDGNPLSSTYYLEPIMGKNFDIDVTGKSSYDFAILYSRYRVNNPLFTDTWPPAGTIYEVKADDATLCAVVEYKH